MLATLQNMNHAYRDFLSKGDARVANWPMMQSPFPPTLLIVCYIYFVKVSGPEWMKNRKPFDLRYLMVAYNFAMVAISGWIFFTIGKYGWFDNYSLRCQPVDYSTNPRALRMAEIGWWFYITKFVEFADTIFFVLRKKSNHISALHVIHHSLVPFSLWFGIKFAPGGYNSFFPFLNCLVHMIMYTYYGLAALGPRFKRFLVWKKYMTTIQMGQFIVVVFYLMQLRWLSNCEISDIFIYLNIFHAMLFLLLFLNFFRKAYKRHHHASARSPVTAKLTGTENGGTNSIQSRTCRESKGENGIVMETTSNFISSECQNCKVKFCDGEVNGNVCIQNCRSSNGLSKRRSKVNAEISDTQGINAGHSLVEHLTSD